MPKTGIRQQMLALRSVMSMAEWQTSSRMAQERLLSLDSFRMARTVALYSPIRNEVDTALLLDHCLSAGKQVFFPAISADTIEFQRVASPRHLFPGKFGIPEPALPRFSGTTAPSFDLIVVPGVAFDITGHRLGFGKGYYDRYLSGLSGELPTLSGLCHDFQLLESLPSEAHDIKMDFVVTAGRLVQCGSN